LAAHHRVPPGGTEWGAILDNRGSGERVALARGFQSPAELVMVLPIPMHSRRDVGSTKRSTLMDLNNLTLSPGSWLVWIVVGLVAGFLASRMVKGGGYGLVGDLVVGLIGAVIGGFLLGFFVQGTVGLFGTIVVAFIGAVVLLFIVRSVSGRRGGRRTGRRIGRA
jgi:uncharacterized membrane protein YeaQ/YmgE (transglycosylase-associated protein family)